MVEAKDTDAMGFHVSSILGNFKHLSKDQQYLYWKNKRAHDEYMRSMNAWYRAGFTSWPGMGLKYSEDTNENRGNKDV